MNFLKMSHLIKKMQTFNILNNITRTFAIKNNITGLKVYWLFTYYMMQILCLNST